ncbi:MAG: hypothetical protein OK422_03120 [Thaumarchaeota archaeon]|nr:hypothetical protein [Nitrososphaerota archaeon]
MKRRRLGQHYLVDRGVVKRILDLACIQDGERVLEIGTGKGVLTTELARISSNVEAYEVDRQNYLATRRRVDVSRVQLHPEDAFQAKPLFDVLVSSLPYSQSAGFIEWLSGMTYNRGIVILQEDFVQKITAKPGSKNYRGISVLAQISAEIVPRDRVERASFSPPPRVDSRLVFLRPRTRLEKTEIISIKRLFSLRRRRLLSAARTFGMDSKLVQSYAVDLRVYQLTPHQVHELVKLSLGAG